MRKVIADYFEAKDRLHEAFGYVEDYVVIPLDDQLEMHWMLDAGEGYNSMCVWSSEPLTKESITAGEKIYSGPIYTQRFLAKWVYRSGGHAMVAVDTRTDGNKLLMVFDEKLECKDDKLRALHRKYWGSGL